MTLVLPEMDGTGKGKRYHRLIEAFLEIIFGLYGGVKHTNHTGQEFGLEFSEDNTLVDHYHANNNGILPSRLFGKRYQNRFNSSSGDDQRKIFIEKRK